MPSLSGARAKNANSIWGEGVLVLFGGDGVVLIDVLCALGGLGGVLGVLRTL